MSENAEFRALVREAREVAEELEIDQAFPLGGPRLVAALADAVERLVAENAELREANDCSVRAIERLAKALRQIQHRGKE